MVKSFVVYYEPGLSWLKGKPLKDRPLKAHLDYMRELHGRGKLIMGGSFADGSGGLVIVAAESIKEVEEILSSDPAIVRSILAATIKEWSRIV